MRLKLLLFLGIFSLIVVSFAGRKLPNVSCLNAEDVFMI